MGEMMSSSGVMEISESLREKIVRVRRELHRIPETALNEFETTDYIVQRLKELGLDTVRITKTGVIGNLVVDPEKCAVAVRADIDALPIEEQNGVDYKSQHPGCMHACGHDGHIAMALGAAEILTHMKDRLQGNVKFIFQPAEEQYGGAQRMIEAGALKNPEVHSVIALHIWPDLEKGKVFFKDGCIMASNDRLVITVKGKSGHGAMPQLCRDALTAGCQIVNAVQIFVAREIDPIDSAVVTFGSFQSGNAYNIVSGKTVISGTVRAVRESTRAMIEKRMREITEYTCRALGVDFEIDYIRQYPPTVNHNDINQICYESAEKTLGANHVARLNNPYLTGEDFSYFLQRVPGCMSFGCPG